MWLMPKKLTTGPYFWENLSLVAIATICYMLIRSPCIECQGYLDRDALICRPQWWSTYWTVTFATEGKFWKKTLSLMQFGFGRICDFSICLSVRYVLSVKEWVDCDQPSQRIKQACTYQTVAFVVDVKKNLWKVACFLRKNASVAFATERYIAVCSTSFVCWGMRGMRRVLSHICRLVCTEQSHLRLR